VQDARRRLTDAAARLADMKAKFNRTVKREPTVVAARRDFDDSKIGYLAADSLLQSTIHAREIALDYAYWSHRWDIYRYLQVGAYDYDGYYPYGFAYGGSAGLLYSRHRGFNPVFTR
jgi:hypothetical protein